MDGTGRLSWLAELRKTRGVGNHIIYITKGLRLPTHALFGRCSFAVGGAVRGKR